MIQLKAQQMIPPCLLIVCCPRPFGRGRNLYKYEDQLAASAFCASRISAAFRERMTL